MFMPILRTAIFTALALGSVTARTDAIATSSVTRTTDGSLVISWSAAGPVDVLVGDQPALDPKSMRLISDDDTDGRHEYRSGDDRRPYFLLRTEREGAIQRTAERVLPLEAGSNFRDVGGYRSADGKHVRWGLIYRTGAMPQLTDRDYALLNQLGIRVFCDLRSVEERELAPTRVDAVADARYHAVDYPASSIFQRLLADSPEKAAATQTNSYPDWPLTLAPQYKEIFTALLAGEAPLAFNCSAGQDRTGVATALVLTALGVPRETILEDYHLSTLHRRPEYERGTGDFAALAPTNVVARFYVESSKRGPEAMKPRPLYDAAGRARLLAAFDAIEKRWGSVPRYLAEVLDVDAQDVQRLRSLYLE